MLSPLNQNGFLQLWFVKINESFYRHSCCQEQSIILRHFGRAIKLSITLSSKVFHGIDTIKSIFNLEAAN